jgi:hypothetical protein
MSELIDWLRLTIEGDKAAAEADLDGQVEWAADYMTGMGPSGERASEHILRHSPGNVSARCEAELAIIKDHSPTLYSDSCPRCLVEVIVVDEGCEYSYEERTYETAPCKVVRQLACGYRYRSAFDAILVLDPAEVAAMLAGAEERRKQPLQTDDLDELRARLDALKADGGLPPREG